MSKTMTFEDFRKETKKLFPNCILEISDYSLTFIEKFKNSNISHFKLFMREIKSKDPNKILELIKCLKSMECEDE